MGCDVAMRVVLDSEAAHSCRLGGAMLPHRDGGLCWDCGTTLVPALRVAHTWSGLDVYCNKCCRGWTVVLPPGNTSSLPQWVHELGRAAGHARFSSNLPNLGDGEKPPLG